MQLADGAADVLEQATTMFVAADTKRGPHVTPELFVAADERLWAFTAADTLKVRTLRRRPHAGLLVRSGDDAVVVAARATVLDAAQPLDVVTSGIALDVPRVTAAFAARHSLEVAGGAADYAVGRFGLVPGRWVLLAFEPLASAVVNGDRLAAAVGWGDLSAAHLHRPGADDVDDADGVDGSDDGPTGDIALDAIPAAVRHLVEREAAAIGWYSAHGPLALPCRWSFETTTARVAAALFTATGCGSEGPLAVTIDEWVAPGPGGKRGVMLRGRGRAMDAGSDMIEVVVHADRAVAWDGTETASVGGIREIPEETGHTASISDPNKDPKKETRAG